MCEGSSGLPSFLPRCVQMFHKQHPFSVKNWRWEGGVRLEDHVFTALFTCCFLLTVFVLKYEIHTENCPCLKYHGSDDCSPNSPSSTVPLGGALFPCPTDVPLGPVTCLGQWNVGSGQRMPTPSLDLKRPVCFLSPPRDPACHLKGTCFGQLPMKAAQS